MKVLSCRTSCIKNSHFLAPTRPQNHLKQFFKLFKTIATRSTPLLTLGCFTPASPYDQLLLSHPTLPLHNTLSTSPLRPLVFLPTPPLLHVTKVTFTSIFHPFFLTFSIPIPLRGGKLPTKRPYCSIPRHYGLLSLPGQHGLHSLLSITKTMMSTMTTGLLTHAAIQYASLYSVAFCGWPY